MEGGSTPQQFSNERRLSDCCLEERPNADAHLVLNPGLVEQRKHLVREAALRLCAGALHECHHLKGPVCSRVTPGDARRMPCQSGAPRLAVPAACAPMGSASAAAAGSQLRITAPAETFGIESPPRRPYRCQQDCTQMAAQKHQLAKLQSGDSTEINHRAPHPVLADDLLQDVCQWHSEVLQTRTSHHQRGICAYR